MWIVIWGELIHNVLQTGAHNNRTTDAVSFIHSGLANDQGLLSSHLLNHMYACNQ